MRLMVRCCFLCRKMPVQSARKRNVELVFRDYIIEGHISQIMLNFNFYYYD